jgi:hypothetical protein
MSCAPEIGPNASGAGWMSRRSYRTLAAAGVAVLVLAGSYRQADADGPRE